MATCLAPSALSPLLLCPMTTAGQDSEGSCLRQEGTEAPRGWATCSWSLCIEVSAQTHDLTAALCLHSPSRVGSPPISQTKRSWSGEVGCLTQAPELGFAGGSDVQLGLDSGGRDMGCKEQAAWSF